MRATLGVVLAGCCAVAVAGSARQPDNPDVVAVRLGGDGLSTRIVIDLRKAARGSVDDAAATPTRIALILKGASAPTAMRGVGRGIVRDWSIVDAPGGMRLTLDLAGRADIARRFLLPPADGVPSYRYVVDVVAPAGAHYTATAQPLSARLSPALYSPAPQRPGHARRIVVIDPGHGGKDSGALGQDTYEKTVTLATALVLKARLEKTGRYQVVMTRVTDTYVSLEDRVQIARRAGADLFLSLHADSASNASVHGATVYTLSDRGSQRVGSVLGAHEWFLQQARQTDDAAVGRILLDLSQRSTRNQSAGFAQMLIERVGDRAPLVDRSQRDANYFVLLAPDVPAALLEMGFMTNATDEARLEDPAQRTALAEKIAQAIDAYFAPRGADLRIAQR